jgi:mxaA protein
MSRRRRSIGLAAGVGWFLAAAGAHAGDGSQLEALTFEPRAFGYQVGDVLQRRIVVQVPDGLALDEASLPRPGARGQALELRSLQRQRAAGREDLLLHYQVFLAPPSVRTLEMPPLSLRFEGQPRAQALRVDAWPVTVAPLTPLEASPRNGLGELQPDAPVPRIATHELRARLWAYVVVATLLLAMLVLVHTAGSWWGRRQRPFARAWQSMHRLPSGDEPAAWRAACARLHAAFNEAGGEVLFEHGIERFIARRPAFQALQDDVRRFLRMSRRGFFGDGGHEPGELAWLLAFGRRCRDAERFP